MTVRWKPLVLLSALFLVVGVGGVLAITLTLVPHSSEGILRRARLAHEAGRYENAEIYYLQALQKDGKNAAIHFEAARLYKDWFDHAPADKKGVLYNHRIDHLKSAVKFDQSMQGPRQALLKAVMHEDLVHESIEWAREVVNVDADNADAHYVLALEALDQRTPNVAEGRRHLEVLVKKKGAADPSLARSGQARQRDRRRRGTRPRFRRGPRRQGRGRRRPGRPACGNPAHRAGGSQ